MLGVKKYKEQLSLEASDQWLEEMVMLAPASMR